MALSSIGSAAHVRVAVVAAFAVVAVAVVGMFGCSSAPVADEGAAPAQGRAMSADEAALPEEQVGEKSQAMVIIAGADPLFVDTATQAPYIPGIPADGVTGLDGSAMAADQLTVGNIVEVTGNGIMLESYPGQYPGISSIRVVEQGEPSNADRYGDIIEQIAGTAAGLDDDAVPAASLAYSTDMANVSLVLEPQAYTWELSNGGIESEELDMLEDNGGVEDDVIDARISAEAAAAVAFDKTPQGVAVTRMALKAADGGYAVDSSVPEEQVESVLKGAEAAFAMTPDALYVINASYEEGSIIYAFVALEPRG